jgi:hypothetical protein
VRLRTTDGRTLWLAYGMNVHAGGSLDTLERALATTVVPLRERLDVEGPMGLALRLDREGVTDLLVDEDRRRLLRDTLAGLDLVPFTANAFVVGDFHAVGTKAEVYRPTWSDPARAAYTLDFAEALAALSEPGRTLSLSTAPWSFKPFAEGEARAAAAAARLAETARGLAAIERRTGVRVRLAVEPEPLCTLETTDEAVAWFRGPLHEALRGDEDAARHLAVCYDVCHQAVEGEDPEASLAALAAAGVPVAKVQLSCALLVPDPGDPAARRALERFEEPRWLHQVAAGAGASRRVAADLHEALRGPDAARWRGAGPWRVHFHVPVHREEVVPPLRTTRDVLERAIRAVVRTGACDHLEIETYTWDGLPPEVRASGLVESLALEHEWVLSVLAGLGVVPDPEDLPA